LKDEKKPFSLTTNNDTKINQSKEEFHKKFNGSDGRSFEDNSS
jgi:hypothetical protein